MRSAAALGACALLLGACGGDGWWGGGSDEPPLPGERVPVMLLERQLTADPRLADIEVSLPQPQRNSEWPQSSGLPNHAMHHLAAADQLELVWSTSVGRSASGSGQLLARPVVGDGRVYAMDARGTISAIDAQGGDVLWRFEPEDPDDGLLGGGLAYSSGWLFAAQSSGEVLGLNAETGTEVWSQDLALPLRSAPAVGEGLVLVLTADNQLYALDAETGRPAWRHAGFFESAGLLGGPTPAVDRGVVVVPYSSAEVYALRLDTGRPLWNDTVQRPQRTLALAEINDIDGSPVIDDGRVYVAGHAGQMAVLDVRRGVRAWDIDLASTETPWVAGDYVYVLTTRGEVVSILRENGRVRWVSPLPRFERPDDPASTPIKWSGPVLVGDRLLLAGSDGELLSMSPYNGEILGRIRVRGPVLVPPVVAEGTVYVLTEDAELYAYR